MLRALALALVLAAGCSSDGRLLVDVRTDLVPGVEFDRVVVDVGGSSGGDSRAASLGDDFVAGVRVADIAGSGEVRFEARLERRGVVIAQRPAQVRVSGTVGVTLTISRDCRGVACPTGGDPTAEACVGGACVDPSCTEETPDACEPECELASDCPTGATCATPVCRGGVCLLAPSACADSEYCDPDGGCLPIPTDGCDPLPATAIAAGPETACAIRARAVVCWGRSSAGQLGVDDVTADALRVPGSGGGAEGIGVGAEHLCVIDARGTVSCAGADGRGQLGLGDGDESTPALAEVAGDFRALYVGPETSCAVDAAGDLHCWGRNEEGQAGVGTFDPVVSIPTPLVSIGEVAEASIGALHACAVTSTGLLACWGSNARRALGRPERDGLASIPRPVMLALPARSVSVGEAHTCAVSTDRDLYCWGDNTNGQFGVPPAVTPFSWEPMRVGEGLSWDTVASGGDHACATIEGGELYCWGRNAAGQVGVAPSAVEVPPIRLALQDVTAVAAGAAFTCASTPSEVRCFGDNAMGQLGVGDLDARLGPQRVCAP